MHLLNIKLISLTLLVTHLDISGNVINDEHPINIKLISLTFFVSHLDISGNDKSEEQL